MWRSKGICQTGHRRIFARRGGGSSEFVTGASGKVFGEECRAIGGLGRGKRRVSVAVITY